MMGTSNRKELFVGLVMALASIIALILSTMLPDVQVLNVGGSKLVPLICTIAMLGFSLWQCVYALFVSNAPISEKFESMKGKRIVAVLIVVLAFSFLLESIGFVASAIGLLIITTPLFGMSKLKVIIIYAIGVSLVTWLLFTKIFSSYFPIGNLF